MNNNNLKNPENVLPIGTRRKADRYKVFAGHIDLDGMVNERDQVGFAFQRIGSQSFKLNLWMFVGLNYFIVPSKEDQTKYILYALDEYITESKELKSYWNKVGTAELYGNYLKLSFTLLSYDLFMSLFDDAQSAQNAVPDLGVA
jgi:hypothetical protein